MKYLFVLAFSIISFSVTQAVIAGDLVSCRLVKGISTFECVSPDGKATTGGIIANSVGAITEATFGAAIKMKDKAGGFLGNESAFSEDRINVKVVFGDKGPSMQGLVPMEVYFGDSETDNNTYYRPKAISAETWIARYVGAGLTKENANAIVSTALPELMKLPNDASVKPGVYFGGQFLYLKDFKANEVALFDDRRVDGFYCDLNTAYGANLTVVGGDGLPGDRDLEVSASAKLPKIFESVQKFRVSDNVDFVYLQLKDQSWRGFKLESYKDEGLKFLNDDGFGRYEAQLKRNLQDTGAHGDNEVTVPQSGKNKYFEGSLFNESIHNYQAVFLVIEDRTSENIPPRILKGHTTFIFSENSSE